MERGEFFAFFVIICSEHSLCYMYTGVALYYLGPISNGRLAANNSLIRSGNVRGFGALLCLSGSRTADVGRWITPQGQDSTYNMTDIFDVSVGGMDNPGNINISLEAGRSIGSSHQGVYACIIPDEGGVEHTLYIGIYPPTFSSKFLKHIGIHATSNALKALVYNMMEPIAYQSYRLQ